MVSMHTVMTIRAYARIACMGPVFVIVMSESVCVTEIRVEQSESVRESRSLRSQQGRVQPG